MNRQESKFLGLLRYTGKSCPRNHNGERKTSNGKCVQCVRDESHYKDKKKRSERNPVRMAKKNRNRTVGEIRYPEKRKARYIVSNAIFQGRLIRQPCEICGDGKSQAHHDDYNSPLKVRWLCQKHHGEHHRRAA